SSLGSQLRKSRTALARHYQAAFDFPWQKATSEPQYGTSEGEDPGAKRQRWASEGDISAKKTDNLSCEPKFGLPIPKFRSEPDTWGSEVPLPHRKYPFMSFKIKFLCKNVWIFPSEAEFSDFELGNWNNYVKNRAFEPRPWTSDPGACQSELQRWGSDVGGGTSEEGQWASEVGVSHSKSGVWT